MSSKASKTDRIHCNECGHETYHTIVSSRKTRFGELLDKHDPSSEIYFVNTYEMLECCGCHNITFRRSAWFSEEPDETSVDYYPPAVSRQLPRWANDLPHSERMLLDEVYAALHAGSCRLAMMGARALIDIGLASRIGDKGTFSETLKKAETEGYIGRQSRKVLHAAFDAGSAAAHRGHIASTDEVNQVIDIVENLLQSVYVLDSLADNLRKKTPPRGGPSKP